jgi:hypothetical protein
VFRIKRDPAKLLDGAVARSSQPFDGFFFMNLLRSRNLIIFGFTLIVSVSGATGQTHESAQKGDAVDGVQLSISENGLIKAGVPKLQVVFRNVTDRDINLNLGYIGGFSPRPCKLDNRDISCTFNFKLNVTDRDGATRTYTFRGMSYVAGRLDPYIIYLRAQSTFTLELGVDQFWSPATGDFQPLALSRELYRLSLEFEGSEPGPVNTGQAYISKMIFWKGKITSNVLSITVARNAPSNNSLDRSHGKRVSHQA